MDVNYRRKRFLDVNSKNLEDKTAWDMLQEDNKEIRVMLRRVGAKPCSSLSTFVKYPNPKYQRLLTPLCVHFIWIKNLRREIRKATEERRSMLLVVAALLAHSAFKRYSLLLLEFGKKMVCALPQKQGVAMIRFPPSIKQ